MKLKFEANDGSFFPSNYETGADVEQYLHYVGGATGMLALTGVGVGVAAASADYLASRPTPTLPPFDLDRQTIVEVNISPPFQKKTNPRMADRKILNQEIIGSEHVRHHNMTVKKVNENNSRVAEWSALQISNRGDSGSILARDKTFFGGIRTIHYLIF